MTHWHFGKTHEMQFLVSWSQTLYHPLPAMWREGIGLKHCHT